MKTLIEFPVDGGDSVIVEVNEEPSARGENRVARAGDIAETATKTLQEALGQIRPAVTSIIAVLRDINEPDEIEVALGIKMSAKAGAFIASADAEANFAVKLTWKKKA